MKPIRPAKKLTLTAETLRQLTTDQLSDIHGGTLTTKLPSAGIACGAPVSIGTIPGAVSLAQLASCAGHGCGTVYGCTK